MSKHPLIGKVVTSAVTTTLLVALGLTGCAERTHSSGSPGKSGPVQSSGTPSDRDAVVRSGNWTDTDYRGAGAPVPVGTGSPAAVAPVSAVYGAGLTSVWQTPLDLASQKTTARAIYLRGETVFVYTNLNRVYALSAKGGKILYAVDVAAPTEVVGPPLVLDDGRTVFPVGASLRIYNKTGSKLGPDVLLTQAIRSPLVAEDESHIFAGLDYGQYGRFARIDLTRRVLPIRWEVLSDNAISSRAAVYGNDIYFADTGGKIYAISVDRNPLWPLEGSYFQAGPVTADITVDVDGVYAASGDTKLYCIDRVTGKVVWHYFAGEPLHDAPMVTSDVVYQPTPHNGVVAIDKKQGNFWRVPLWSVPQTNQYLGRDDTHVFLRTIDGAVTTVDRKTGKTTAATPATAGLLAASNLTDDGVVYTITPNGQVEARKFSRAAELAATGK